MKLKDNNERKEWLKNYRDWELWYEDDHIGAKYYLYVFDNGAELIAAEYLMPGNQYVPEYTQTFYYLVGGPEETNGKWVYQKHHDPTGDSETYLVEFIKSLGRDYEF